MIPASPALAGPFEPARSREPLPAREVERGLASPRGWSQTGLQLSARSGGGSLLGDRRLTLDHGLTDRLEARVGLSHRTHRVGGLVTVGLADPTVGVRWTAIEAPVRGRWLTVEVRYRGPLGQGHPNPEVHGPPIAAPTSELRLEVVGRQRWGALRVDLGGVADTLTAGWVGTGRLSRGLCDRGWTVPVAWMAPEMNLGGFLAGLLQAGPLQVRGSVDALRVGGRPMRVVMRGRNPKPLLGCVVAAPLDPSAAGALPGGWFVGSTVGGGVQLSRGLQLDGWVQMPLSGEGRSILLLDHGPGTTLGGGVEVAW